MALKIKFVFVLFFAFLLFIQNSFSQTILSFPEDSARWYLQKSTPSKTGCDRSFIRYYSKGDTVVGSTKYHKVYRQTSLDSASFPESKDTLRIFMRMSADSQQVIMRFVDSINGYDIMEHVVGDFSLIYKPSADTFPRFIMQNGNRKTQKTIGFSDVFLDNCSFLIKDGYSLPIYSFLMKLIDTNQQKSILRDFYYFTVIGDREKSWFAIDLDSAGINAFHPSFCNNVAASLYKLELSYSDKSNISTWYEVNLDCTVGLESITFSTSFKVQHSETIKSIKLIDATGKMFLNKNYNSVELEKTIKSESLKPGIYFLIVNGEYSKKVLKY